LYFNTETIDVNKGAGVCAGGLGKQLQILFQPHDKRPQAPHPDQFLEKPMQVFGTGVDLMHENIPFVLVSTIYDLRAYVVLMLMLDRDSYRSK
jgi:hypothetical protein